MTGPVERFWDGALNSSLNWYQGVPLNGEVEFFDADDCNEDARYTIKTIPTLSDCFMYLIISNSARKALAVDPVTPFGVLKVCRDEGCTISAIFTTHCFQSGGNSTLAEAVPGIEVYAGEHDADRTPSVTQRLADGETFNFEGLTLRCIATPCHTRGHVSLFLNEDDGQPPALFTGDSLLVAGFGRFNEGDAEMAINSLAAISSLPPVTRIFCGHEHAVPNLEFAASLEPDNELVSSRLQRARERITEKIPNTPSTLFEEKQQNPFMRIMEPVIMAAVDCPDCKDPVEVMTSLRMKRDNFGLPDQMITAALSIKNVFSEGIVCGLKPRAK